MPFQRLGDRDNHAGVGLGLALSRGLAEAMGGTLTPDTTPGGGLTMILRLPSAETRVVATEEEATALADRAILERIQRRPRTPATSDARSAATGTADAGERGRTGPRSASEAGGDGAEGG
jgi:two-component system sensor histidine kinase KdpD